MSSVSMTQDRSEKSCSFAQKKTDIRIDKILGVTVDEGNVTLALVRPISTYEGDETRAYIERENRLEQITTQ